MVSSIGSHVAGVGTLLLLYIVFRTLRSGARAAENPWSAGRDHARMVAAVTAALPHVAAPAACYVATSLPIWMRSNGQFENGA